jgi:LmbE family N-acetylglucosaminyl deacetylase
MSIISRAIRRGRRLARRLTDGRRYRDRSLLPQPDASRLSIADLAQRPVLVIVAHPDDEVIGVGALLTRLPSAGVITVTDGAPRNLRLVRAEGFNSSRAYGRARQAEAQAALALLGRDFSPVANLGIPDQQAVFRIVAIVHRLMRLMREGRFAYVVTHPYEGGHPDHDATALAVHAACRLLRNAGIEAPVPVEMTSYHAADGATAYGGFLPHPGAGPVETLHLDEAEADLKRRMFACHASQARVLAPFPLDAERFRAAPAYDFLQPPHLGRLGYERYDWDIDGRIWRDEAVRALHRLKLLAPM